MSRLAFRATNTLAARPEPVIKYMGIRRGRRWGVHDGVVQSNMTVRFNLVPLDNGSRIVEYVPTFAVTETPNE